VTDVARITALLALAKLQVPTTGLEHAADPLPQLAHAPSAIVPPDANECHPFGTVMLSLRPSGVAGGRVGPVDVLTIDPRHASDGVDAASLAGTLRVARRAGMVAVEAEPGPDRRAELWARTGFIAARARLFLAQREQHHRSPA
jgi:hypothetical protein